MTGRVAGSVIRAMRPEELAHFAGSRPASPRPGLPWAQGAPGGQARPILPGARPEALAHFSAPPGRAGRPLNTDPPAGVPWIEGEPRGGVVIRPLAAAGYTGDDAGPINEGLQQLPAAGGLCFLLGAGPAVPFACLSPVGLSTGVRLFSSGWQACDLTFTGTYLFDMDPATGLASTGNLEDVEIDHLSIVGQGGGELFYGANIVRSQVHHCALIQNDVNFAIWNCQASAALGTTYMAENSFYFNKEILGGSGNRAISAWYCNGNGGFRVNDNWWFGNVCFNNCHDETQWWYRVIGYGGPSMAPGYGSRNNRFQKLTFEYPQGGMIRLESTTGDLIEDVTLEDLAALGVGSNALISLGTSAGNDVPCAAITIRNYARRGGTNVGTDIDLGGSDQVTIDSPSQESGGAAFTVNLNGATNVAFTGAWPDAPVIEGTGTFSGPNLSAWAAPNSVLPADYGYQAWVCDPAALPDTPGVALAASGTVCFARMPVRELGATVTTIRVHLVAAGTGLISGECYCSLYDDNFNQIGVTTGQATAWSSAGTIDMVMTASAVLTTPFVNMAFLYNGTSSPMFLGNPAPNASMGGGVISGGPYRFGTAQTGRGTMPNALSGQAPAAGGWWAAVY